MYEKIFISFRRLRVCVFGVVRVCRRESPPKKIETVKKQPVKVEPAETKQVKEKKNITNPFYMVDGGFMSDTKFSYEHYNWRYYGEQDSKTISRTVTESITYGFNDNFGVTVQAGRKWSASFGGDRDASNSYGAGISFIPFADEFKARIDAFVRQDDHNSRFYTANAAVGYEFANGLMPMVTFDYTHEDNDVKDDPTGNNNDWKAGAYLYGESGDLSGQVGLAYHKKRWFQKWTPGKDTNAEERIEARIGYMVTDSLALSVEGAYGFHNTRTHYTGIDDNKLTEIYGVNVGVRYVF